MIKERKEIDIVKQVVCPKCSGNALYISYDTYTNKQNKKVVWDVLYKCEDCSAEWIKPFNNILAK